jgi:hypothetical protein
MKYAAITKEMTAMAVTVIATLFFSLIFNLGRADEFGCTVDFIPLHSHLIREEDESL